MKNELRIKPLLEYAVTRAVYEGNNERSETDVFTAESYECLDKYRYLFYRTGNVVREYSNNIIKIVVTPVEGE